MFTPNNDFYSSHASVVRLTRPYVLPCCRTDVPLVQRSFELFRQLESQHQSSSLPACAPLLTMTGGLMIGRPDSPVVVGTRASAETHRLPHQILSAAEVRDRCPPACYH
jgi:sarcosine oxidase